MTDEPYESMLERAASVLRAPSPRDDASLDETLYALRVATREGDAGVRAAPFRGRRQRPVSRGLLKYAAGLAAGIAFAAGLGIGLFAGWRMRGAAVAPRLERLAPASALAENGGRVTRSVEFVLVAPRASRVALVGEFNDWDPDAAPMERVAGGAWTTALPLTGGRHLYAFVVDGRDWVPDPQAPLAPERWFGTRNSVLLVEAPRP